MEGGGIAGDSGRFDMTDNSCYGTCASGIHPTQVVAERASYVMMIISTSFIVALLMFGWFLFLFDFGRYHNYFLG